MIPELIPYNQWINWRPTTKAPIGSINGTLLTFNRALEQDRFHIGFVLKPEDPFTCVDLDDCFKDLQELNGVLSLLDSYTELSPSGNGLHIWIKAKLKGKNALRKPGIEIYSAKRFMTVTGDEMGKSPVNPRQKELEELVGILK